MRIRPSPMKKAPGWLGPRIRSMKVSSRAWPGSPAPPGVRFATLEPKWPREMTTITTIGSLCWTPFGSWRLRYCNRELICFPGKRLKFYISAENLSTRKINFQGSFNSNGRRNVVVFHADHDLFVHSQFGSFLDGGENGFSDSIGGRFVKTAQHQVRMSWIRIDASVFPRKF